MTRNLLQRWFGRRPSQRGTPGRRPARRVTRPSLEVLEDRTVPTVFNVGASDVSTLITDIKMANGNGDTSNTINLTASTYDLTAVDNNWYGPNGLPPITSNLTIHGNGATIQRDLGASTPDFRLFYVSGGLELPVGSLTMNNVTLQNGVAQGGNSNLGGGGLGAGGAIFNQGTINLTSVTLTNDEALGGSAGDTTAGNGGGGMGQGSPPTTDDGGGFGGSVGAVGGTGGAGGIGNGGGGGGGFLTGANGTAGSNVAGSPVAGVGGGQGGFAQSGHDGGTGGVTSDAGVSGSGGNFGAGGEAGGQGDGDGGGGGGGVGVAGAMGGSGGFGGGGGDGFTGGGGGFGGGGGGTVLANGTPGAGGFGGGAGTAGGIGGGGAGMGGAIFNMGANGRAGTATLVNCTLTQNFAFQALNRGQPTSEGLGGAIFNLDGSVTLTNDTLDTNQATNGGTVYNLAFGNDIRTGGPVTATLVLNNSILADSHIFSQSFDLVNNVVNGAGTNTATVTGSHNLVATSQGTIGAGVITQTASPNLGPLQNNGGLTPTMLPQAGSVALGAGDPSLAPPTDQRGLLRPVGGPTDLGSVQVTDATTPPPPGSTTGSTTGSTSSPPAPSLISAIFGLFIAEAEKDLGFGNPAALQQTIDFDAQFTVIFGINIAPLIEQLADSDVAQARGGA